jgi:phosphonate transport system substrate-binding protein
MRALLLTVGLVVACTPLEDRSPPSPPRVRPSVPAFLPPQGFEQLRFGLVPSLSPKSMVDSHQRLADYLSKVLSVPVELQVGTSFGDVLEHLGRGEFDLVELSPTAYVRARARGPLRCLVQNIADGSESGVGYLVVTDDSPRRDLADLRGASIGYVDPLSTSGYVFAVRMLVDRGLDPKKDLGRAEFFGNHEAVLMAVKEGRVDVGATYQGAIAALRRSEGVEPRTFRVIAKSHRMPRDILCVRPGLPEAVADTISKALLAIDTRDRVGREILGPLGLNGYRPADDHAYDDVGRFATDEKP